MVLIVIVILARITAPSVSAPEASAEEVHELHDPSEHYVVAQYVEYTPTKKTLVRVLPAYPKSEITEYIKTVFGAHASTALRIANCESGFNPYVVNNNPRTRDYSVGVFQINLYGKLAANRPSEEWLKDYRNNIDYAHRMFLASGFQPWSCY